MKKKFAPLLGLLGLVVIAGLAVGAWQAYGPGFAPTAAPSPRQTGYTTSAVTRGDLSAAISGSGSVVARQTADLAFLSAGVLGDLNVQPGDTVTQGQALAALSDIPALQQEVQNRQLAVQQEEQALQDLQSGGPAALAKAQADVAAAETNLAGAQKGLRNPGVARCDKATLQTYYFAYLKAKNEADVWQGYLDDGNTGYGRDYILKTLAPLKKAENKAYINYTYCQGYTQAEISSSHAALQAAQANLAQARAADQKLQAENGLDPLALQQAQAQLDSAKLQLASAQQNLKGATLTAPFAGTVLAVNAQSGDPVGTGTLITIANLSEPQVQVNIDESDLASFAAGCSASVTFDSLPGQTFAGQVASVAPVMATSRSVQYAQGLVDLQQGKTISGKDLPLGLTGTVELSCQEAANTLLVPSNAVYTSIDGPAYVYVLNAQGQPEKRTVTPGVSSVAQTQILTGLSEGELVITSPVQ